jgi:hypothetical protein
VTGESFFGNSLHPCIWCNNQANDLHFSLLFTQICTMQLSKQAFLLLAALSVATTAFVVPSGRGTTFGLCTRSFSAVFSEATDDAAVSDAVPASEVVKASAEEKFTIYVSNVPFGKLSGFEFFFSSFVPSLIKA